MLKKSIVVGIICLLILTSIPTVLSNEDKPDLIIEDIVKKPSDIPILYWVYCTVRNIGDAKAEGFIDIEVDMIWMLFGKIPLVVVKSFSGSAYLEGGVQPGEAIDIFFAEIESFPYFGTYKLSSVVNPDGEIPEKIYNNNWYDKNCFIYYLPLPFLGYTIIWLT